MEWHSSGLAVD